MFPLHKNSTYSWPGQFYQVRNVLNWLFRKVASYDGATLKVTELFSKAILLTMFCLWRLHGCVLDFIHLSATGVAEIAKSTNLKGCSHTFVYIVCIKNNPKQSSCSRACWEIMMGVVLMGLFYSPQSKTDTITLLHWLLTPTLGFFTPLGNTDQFAVYRK